MLTKKGAMFGLDARIALAIFGALSVISGAALYSAIENSKTTALVNQISEINNAYEQYLLDTGSHVRPTSVGANSYTVKAGDLVLNPGDVQGWSGPYIGLEINPADIGSKRNLLYKDYLVTFHRIKKGISFGESVTIPSVSGSECLVGDECELWLSIKGIDKQLASQIDIMIDGSADLDAGNLRYVDSSKELEKRIIMNYTW